MIMWSLCDDAYWHRSLAMTHPDGFGSRLRSYDEAKAEDWLAGGWATDAAARCPAVLSHVDPTAAAVHAVVAVNSA
jgi:hypothetical protein